MVEHTTTHLSQRYTGLSDRFRSLWTFYQFLGGVFKHQRRGSLPFEYDFQSLYRRLQNLANQIGIDGQSSTASELAEIEDELGFIHRKLAAIELDFPPSQLRRFFDHLKKQDQKILFALVKFYLMSDTFDEDMLDKLDMLLTRLAEVPLDDGRVLLRDPSEVQERFERFAKFVGVRPLPAAEEQPLVQAIREYRLEIQSYKDFATFLESGVLDRYRKCKHRLGKAFIHPPVLVQIISANIEAKNRFRELYQEEEMRILEDTNRIFEIERYLERNPGLAHDQLRRQLDTFRKFRVQFDSGRRDDNLKREDILELRQAMHQVLETFDQQLRPTGAQHSPEADAGPFVPAPAFGEPITPDAPHQPVVDTDEPLPIFDEVTDTSIPLPPNEANPQVTYDVEIRPQADPGRQQQRIRPETLAEEMILVEPDQDGISLAGVLPPDPLIDESLHKIMFALELVIWERSPEEAVYCRELHHLRLEPWEVATYRKLAERRVVEGSLTWELERFFLTSAALRVKMEEEIEEISRLNQSTNSERFQEILEHSTQSLERAGEVNRRFRWFIDDILFRGDTERLEQIYRSHFRFMRAFSQLWLDHQSSGGVTPL